MSDGLDRLLADVNDMMNRFGLLPDGYRLAWERVAMPSPADAALMVAYADAKVRESRCADEPLCTRPKNHEGPHERGRETWESCGFVASPRLAGAQPCVLPQGHGGDHLSHHVIPCQCGQDHCNRVAAGHVANPTTERA